MRRGISASSFCNESARFTGIAAVSLCLFGSAAAGTKVFAAPLAAGAAGARTTVEYSESDPSPIGNLRVARPTLSWHIVPHGSARITDVVLRLNGRLTNGASYDADRHDVIYTPVTPLAPGRYSVSCTVQIDGRFAVDKDWDFTISPTAATRLDDPDPTQTALIAEINAVRKQINLPALTLDARLCAAAENHSSYLAQNRTEIGHTESAGHAGYVGATTGDRVNAFGYPGSCYESISQGVSLATAAVRKLFDAPYHRYPFLQPGSFDIGSGMKSDVTTLLFGACSDGGVVTYPTDGQSAVPVSWNGNETPNPLRLHGISGTVGYAITYFVFGADDPQITVARATLTDSKGRVVPVFLNTPANDELLHNGAILIPRRPLAPKSTYRVTVQATDDIGQDRSHSWTFTTGAN